MRFGRSLSQLSSTKVQARLEEIPTGPEGSSGHPDPRLTEMWGSRCHWTHWVADYLDIFFFWERCGQIQWQRVHFFDCWITMMLMIFLISHFFLLIFLDSKWRSYWNQLLTDNHWGDLLWGDASAVPPVRSLSQWVKGRMQPSGDWPHKQVDTYDL